MEIEESTSTPKTQSTSAVNDKTEASNAGMEEPSYKEPRMSLGCAISTCLKKYCVFKGRARRSEFWWFMLFCFVVELVAAILFYTMFSEGTAVILNGVIGTALFLPMISVTFRRQHDAGHSGTFLILAFILCCIIDIYRPKSPVGILELITFICIIKRSCEDSEPYENKYGPSPKYH